MEQSKFYQIKNVTGHEYTLVGCDGSVITHPIQDVDRLASAFTIQDAKNGDVLVDRFSKDNIIILYKGINPKLSVLAYCGWNGYNLSIKTNGLGYGNLDNTNYYPATKEQRGLLFKKIHEAGYEWDADKKELREIDNEEVNGEDYGIDGLWHAQRILEKTLGKVNGYQTDDGILEHKCAIAAVNKLYKQKPAWSEEDETNLTNTIIMLKEGASHHFTNFSIVPCVNWLKSLKGRVQPKQEWNEEDDDDAWLNDIISKAECNLQLNKGEINWLKSLRPQNRWKPSDEQMIALRQVISGCSYDIEPLVELETKLKEL